MIVRILEDNQYRLDDRFLGELNQLDNQLVAVVDADKDAEFASLLNQMAQLVRSNGEPLDVAEIVQSDVILPADDTTFAEAKSLFSGEGVVPG